MSTCCLLKCLKIRKIEGPKWSPPTHPDNKGYGPIFFWRITSSKLKPQFSFSNHILKWKDLQVDPLGSAFADSLRGIKIFAVMNINNKRYLTPYLVFINIVAQPGELTLIIWLEFNCSFHWLFWYKATKIKKPWKWHVISIRLSGLWYKKSPLAFYVQFESRYWLLFLRSALHC